MKENILLIYILSVLIGMILEMSIAKLHFYLTKRHYKIHHFTFAKYFLFLLFPLLSVSLISYLEGLTIIKVFIAFALVGCFIEWLVGYGYDQIIGQRLWTYHTYSISKYTSFLSIPLWGFLGASFYIIMRIF